MAGYMTNASGFQTNQNPMMGMGGSGVPPQQQNPMMGMGGGMGAPPQQNPMGGMGGMGMAQP